jgi:RimJ/RimL family protein N-acetyltransferase
MMEQTLEESVLGPRTLADWTPPARPGAVLEGRRVRLEPLKEEHAAALHAANSADTEGRMWLYMSYGPFPDEAAYRAWVEEHAGRPDPFFYAAIDPARGPLGVASYLRIDPPAGSIEVGHIALSPHLQRTTAATEVIYMMMAWAFEAGYRRFEWKTNALNRASRVAALRLGLSYEGVVRQAAVVKGRNRDTAWYAAFDHEWPALRQAFEAWLDPTNFDTEGRQRTSLSELTRPLLVATG